MSDIGRFLVAVLLPVASLGLPAPVAAAADDHPSLGSYYAQKISWASCAAKTAKKYEDAGHPYPKDIVARLECGTMYVPRDYAHPKRQPDIKLATLRLKATGPGERLGSLLVNFGGPGAAGDLVVSRELSKLNTRYDLVAPSPRGVGLSEPVDCGQSSQREDDFAQNEDLSPDTLKEATQYAQVQVLQNKRCGEKAGKILPWVGTTNVSRDLDVLRAALGEEKLNYLGYSYGTRLGAVYQHQFPDKAGRMVLDGVINPSWDTRRTQVESAKAFQSALDAFIADCTQRGVSQCPLGDDPKEAQSALVMLNQKLDTGAIDTSAGALDQAGFIQGIKQALYTHSGWEKLRTAFRSFLDERDGAPFVELSKGGVSATRAAPADAASGDHESDAFTAISCRDTSDRYTPENYVEMLPELDKASPLFGRGMGVQLLNCTQWPVEGDNSWRNVSSPHAPPALIVSTTRDPATPYAGGAAMAEALGNGSRLLTRDGDGHTAYRKQNTCVYDRVNQYLLAGRMPDDGTRCSP